MGYSGRFFGLPCRSVIVGDGLVWRAAISFGRQQCLYFFPLPQGQGSLRETRLRSMAHLQLFVASRENRAGSALAPTAAQLELLAATAGAWIVPPDPPLLFGLAGQCHLRHLRQAGLGPGHVSRLLAGQLFEGEQQHTCGVALKLLDSLPVFFLLGFFRSQPFVVFELIPLLPEQAEARLY